jgi:GNAT superfamily N-acetyltransferase
MRAKTTMSARTDTIVKKPNEYSPGELEEFRKLVLAGGEVAADGLAARINQAAALAFVRAGRSVLGVAALKRPAASYRKSISSKAGVPLSQSAFPYELGWVFVSPKARGQGMSRKLVEALVSMATEAGLFATSRSNNVAMHRSLERCGFAPIGDLYYSDQGNHKLRLFTRNGKSLEARTGEIGLPSRSAVRGRKKRNKPLST